MVTASDSPIAAVTGCPPSSDGFVTGHFRDPSHRFPNPGEPVTPGARCKDIAATRHNLPAGRNLVTGVTGSLHYQAHTRAHAHAISVNRRPPSHPPQPVTPPNTPPATQTAP